VSASQTPLAGNEFELGESTCGGDSGGPAIDETTGAVVGIMSRGYSDCTLNYGHVFMALQGFQDVFTQAFAAAGGSWYDENGPQPTVDAGASSSGGGSGGQSSGSSGAGSGSGGSSSSGGSGGGSSGSHYGGGYNLQSGKGAGCSAAPAGAGADGACLAAFAAIGAAGLIARRRRVLR
jgi:MYXO-CTERM domain-containing protein